MRSKGRIAVDPWLRPIGKGNGNIYGNSILVVGDSSLIVSGEESKIPLPQSAQVAAQQGAYAARLFNRLFLILIAFYVSTT